ncbi:MAG: hypothetical protein MMC33_002529 [Icmadophila ericetorum]|nr:hypothetical protein [Icmadophila ericetorum]
MAENCPCGTPSHHTPKKPTVASSNDGGKKDTKGGKDDKKGDQSKDEKQTSKDKK